MDQPGLADLIDPRRATERLGLELGVTSAAPTYVRHKPGETTIVAFAFTLADGERTWGYAHWCAESRRADEIQAKAAALRLRPGPLGPGLHRLDPHTVLYAFPNDARLRRLRWYAEPRKLKRSLRSLTPVGGQLSGSRSDVQLVRYKPERRAVLAVDLATVDGRLDRYFLRYTARPRALPLAAVAERLRHHGIRVPRPAAQLDGGRVAVDELVAGQPLRDTLTGGYVSGAPLADALTRFHGVPPLTGLPRRTAVTEAAAARNGLAALATWEPGLASRAASVADRLVKTLPAGPGPAVLLHGDLHTENILATGAGPTFVDLERVAIGPAEIDLGYLRAHAVGLTIRQPRAMRGVLAFADEVISYYRLTTQPVAATALAWYTAAGLIDQALLVSRHLEPGWRTTAPLLLDAALEQLDRSATLSVVLG